MSHTHTPSRRNFLTLSARLAALGLGSLAVGGSTDVFAANVVPQAPVTDYKALVCIYLFGGHDGNNLIVPLETTQYNRYTAIRGALALGANKLLTPIAGPNNTAYALHYGLTDLNPLYNAGQLAVVLNTGLLERPLSQTEYLAGVEAPSNLFSHSDQTVQAQTGTPKPDGSGWGGRLLDCWGNADTLAAVSLASPALFLQGKDVGGNAIPPGITLNLNGMNFWPSQESDVRRQMLDSILTQDGGNMLRATANKSMADGLQLAQTLQNAGGSGPSGFPGTAIGKQLQEVARLIQIRSSQGPGRQVFFVAHQGFDTHSGQDYQQWALLTDMSKSLSVFHNVIGGLGLGNQVTAFTQSEFGRTLQPSGSGSDHAWGSHQIVLGGAVQGGIYGQMPTFVLGGPDDANNRGVWIPKISTSQFGATLGRWFGATEQNIGIAFPNLTKFTSSDVGFMNLG